MPQPSQLFLEEQEFSRSYCSFRIAQCVVFSATIGCQGCFADCGCEMPRRPCVSSIQSPCLTAVQHNCDTDCPVNGHFGGYGKVVIEEDTFCQSAEGRRSSFNTVLDFAVQAAAVTHYVTQVCDSCTFERVSPWTEKETAGRSLVTTDDKTPVFFVFTFTSRPARL